jgi:hypothetical protein
MAATGESTPVPIVDTAKTGPQSACHVRAKSLRSATVTWSRRSLVSHPSSQTLTLRFSFVFVVSSIVHTAASIAERKLPAQL